MPAAGRRAWGRGAEQRLVPALVIAVVVALEIATGSNATVLSLVVTAPLLSAASCSLRVTAGYAILALLTAAALGVYGHQYAPGQLSNQLVRMSTVGAGGALAIVSARARARREARLARVLRVAAVAQQAILPPVPERLGHLRLAASYDSAAEDAQVGGDAYAVEQTAFGVRILVADVRGHGLEAVRLAAALLGAFRERAHDRDDLRALVADLDRAVLRGAQDEDFATGLVVQVCRDRMTLLNAGHAPPLLFRGGQVTTLPPPAPSPPLGLGADPWPPLVIELRPDDRLLFHTDGVTEARRPTDGQFFPLETVAPACLAPADPTLALASLRRELAQWSGGKLQDDITLLLVDVGRERPANLNLPPSRSS